MTEVISGLQAISVHIRDIQKARTFYREVLGLKEVSFDGAANRAVFAIPGIPSRLTMHIMAPEEGGREPGTVSGVSFRSTDPAAACEEITRRGGVVTVEPRNVEAGGTTFVRAVFADPDGNEFVLSNRQD
ncbi:MAG: VOC family protein [Thermoplasmata archaeon]